MNCIINITISILPLLFIAVTIFCIWILRKDHGSDIRIVWYFLSLAVVVTMIISLWAVNKGALGQNGTFQGTYGEILSKLLKVMTDLNTDLYVLGAILALITLPQLGSYVLSGLSGNAKTPLLIKESLGFFAWGLIKSLATSAGIFLCLAAFGIYHNWFHFDPDGFVLIRLSLGLIMLSFCILFMFRETGNLITDLKKLIPLLFILFSYLHNIFTEKGQEKSQPKNMEEIDVKDRKTGNGQESPSHENKDGVDVKDEKK